MLMGAPPDVALAEPDPLAACAAGLDAPAVLAAFVVPPVLDLLDELEEHPAMARAAVITTAVTAGPRRVLRKCVIPPPGLSSIYCLQKAKTCQRFVSIPLLTSSPS
jgi:hypothetical protein